MSIKKKFLIANITLSVKLDKLTSAMIMVMKALKPAEVMVTEHLLQ